MKFPSMMFLAAAAVLALPACSSTDVVRAPVEATIGQQLIDLKSAFNNGAMNRNEYDSQRRRLIDSVK